MFWRNRHETKYGDPTTDELVRQGVYSFNTPDTAGDKRLFARRERKERKEHNMLSGMWYVFILSCLLWWLPLFGQMIAGYLGGRKAGSAIKGIIVTVIPAVIILALFLQRYLVRGLTFGSVKA